MIGTDLLAKVMPRMTKVADGSGMSFLDALNNAVDFVFERLHRKRAAVIRTKFSAFTVNGEVETLPSDFRGVASRWFLADVDDNRTEIIEQPPDFDETTTGEDPLVFRLYGVRQIQFLPTPTEDYTLEGWYYAHPGVLTLASTIPWGGLFDVALAEIIVVLVTAGSFEFVQRGIRETIELMIDGVLAGQTTTPRRNKLCL